MCIRDSYNNLLGLSVTPDGTRLYVANANPNTVSVVDTSSNTVIGTVTVGAGPVAFGQFIGPALAPSLTPVPSTFVLAGIGMTLAGLYWLRYRNRPKKA